MQWKKGIAGVVVTALFALLNIIYIWVYATDSFAFQRERGGVLAVAYLVMALVATACDLIESRFKREFDVKDSSCFLPAGMGGLLDMFDSVLFIPALAYPFLLAFSL